MGKHIDYVEQSDGTFKWELAEIPAVKSSQPVKTEEKKKAAPKNYYNTNFNKRLIYGNRRKSNSA